MIYSLNEIDTHCKKAARGVGFEWGHAEDIGKAARWLTTFELPGVNLVRQYLTQIEQCPKTLSAPALIHPDQIQTTNQVLCPIQTGCYLTDVLSVDPDREYSFERLGFPLLLLPFLSRLADQTKLSIHYLYDDNQFHYDDGKLKCNTNNLLTSDSVQRAKYFFTSESVNGENARVTGQEINESDWKQLNNYACKTYVPATEKSRRGAGPSE